MPRSHFKSNIIFSRPKSLNVDKENGIIKNVSIVNHGKNKNGTYFNDQFLADIVTKGNEQKQGVKSRFGHPNMCSNSLGTFLGRYKNFKIKEKGVYADLHLDPVTKQKQVDGGGISMFDYVIQMAENNPDMFGNSIHINSEIYEEKVGDVYFNSHKLESLIASDLVDDPAATENLFANSNDLGIAVTDFLDNNPTIFDVIQRDSSILDDFFDRYTNYLTQFKNNEKMSFLDKLKKKFSANDTFDVNETTAAGDIITIVTEDETPKVGDAVKDSEGKPLADGDTVLKDGSTLVIEGGKITEIKEAEEEEDPEPSEEPTLAEVMQSVNSLATTFGKFQKTYQKDLKENQDGLELIADQVSKFDARVTTLAKSVTSKKTEYSAETPPAKKKFNQSGYDPDKVREAREARKSPKK